MLRLCFCFPHIFMPNFFEHRFSDGIGVKRIFEGTPVLLNHQGHTEPIFTYITVAQKTSFEVAHLVSNRVYRTKEAREHITPLPASEVRNYISQDGADLGIKARYKIWLQGHDERQKVKSAYERVKCAACTKHAPRWI